MSTEGENNTFALGENRDNVQQPTILYMVSSFAWNEAIVFPFHRIWQGVNLEVIQVRIDIVDWVPLVAARG